MDGVKQSLACWCHRGLALSVIIKEYGIFPSILVARPLLFCGLFVGFETMLLLAKQLLLWKASTKSY